MNFRNISAWAIRNPVPRSSCSRPCCWPAWSASCGMDVKNDPGHRLPDRLDQHLQPGAAPTELETQVTQRVEAAVRAINGVDEINSSVSEGNSQTFVQFDIGTPVDRAVNDVRDAIAQIRSDLPDGILEPQVGRASTSGDDIASWAVDRHRHDARGAELVRRQHGLARLLSVPGMAAVSRTGGVRREIRVILDPAKMQAHGITASQVNQQLRQININAAGGRAEIAGSEQSVRVLGNARNAYQLGETQISLGGGRTVQLADIAEVRDLYAEQRNYATMNGRQVLSLRHPARQGLFRRHRLSTAR